jgi:hypothetical protein
LTGNFRIYAADADGDTVVADDGTSSIWIAEPQLEVWNGVAPSEYVGTEDAARTVSPNNVIYLYKGAVQPPGYSVPDYIVATGWISLPNVLAMSTFIRAAVEEANGTADWAKWVYGVEDLIDAWLVPKGSGTLAISKTRFYAEAQGSASWARWAPGANLTNLSGALQLDLQAAFLAGFQLT